MTNDNTLLDFDDRRQELHTVLKSTNNLFRCQRKCYIQTLLLRNNMLTTLAPYSKSLTDMRHSLREITLRNNEFTEFPEEIIVLVNLTSLSLAKNQLRFINMNIFPQLSQLTWLSLSNNFLQELPSDLDRCQNLLGIDISNNEFNHMPPVIYRLIQLKVLLIQKNKLQTLPEYRVFPPSLQTLNLGFNHFESLPNILVYDPPTHLTHLHMSGNPIKVLPTDFLKYEYRHLVNLDLHTCQLKQLSSQFFTYISKRRIPICRLNLAINQLTYLPDTIGLATSLQWLNLNDNQLRYLPTTMMHLHYLAKLGLVQNQLKELPAYLFYRMQYLEKIDLRRNQLSYLPPSILSLAPSCEIHQHIDLAVPSIAFPTKRIHTHQSKFYSSTSTTPSSFLFDSLQNKVYYDTNSNNKRDEYTDMVDMMDNSSGYHDHEEYLHFGGSLKTLLLYENTSLEHKDGIFCFKKIDLLKENYGEDQHMDNKNNNNEDGTPNWYPLISMEKLKYISTTAFDNKYPSNLQTLRKKILLYLNKIETTNHGQQQQQQQQQEQEPNIEEEEEEEEEHFQHYLDSFTQDFPSLKDLALYQYLKKCQHKWIMNHATKQCYTKFSHSRNYSQFNRYEKDSFIKGDKQRLIATPYQQNILSLCRLDIHPETRFTFLSSALPSWLPCLIRQQIIEKAKQCDNCGQWSMALPFQVGYLARLCNNRMQVPIRYSLCSSTCAMDSAQRILSITDNWCSQRLESALNLTENNHTSSTIHDQQQQQEEDEDDEGRDHFYGYSSMLKNFYDDTNQFSLPILHHHQDNNMDNTHEVSPSSSTKNFNKVRHNATSFMNRISNGTSLTIPYGGFSEVDLYQPSSSSNITYHGKSNTLSEALFQREYFKITDPHPHLTSFNHFPGDAIRLERF
ncbi:hypothetical protein BJ944DRAFT_250318 [Cunninghamella echinulata]|nr:hypothetical protein BJ944DRAFT_250318 [Cunninghamella echinulata]